MHGVITVDFSSSTTSTSATVVAVAPNPPPRPVSTSSLSRPLQLPAHANNNTTTNTNTNTTTGSSWTSSSAATMRMFGAKRDDNVLCDTITRFDLLGILLDQIAMPPLDEIAVLCTETCTSLLRVLKTKGSLEVKNKIAESILLLLTRLEGIFSTQQHMSGVEYQLILALPTLFTAAVTATPLLYELKRRGAITGERALLALGAARLSTIVMKKDDVGQCTIEEMEACQKIVGVL
jgi:hypothetical protein